MFEGSGIKDMAGRLHNNVSLGSKLSYALSTNLRLIYLFFLRLIFLEDCILFYNNCDCIYKNLVEEKKRNIVKATL